MGLILRGLAGRQTSQVGELVRLQTCSRELAGRWAGCWQTCRQVSSCELQTLKVFNFHLRKLNFLLELVDLLHISDLIVGVD